MKKLFAGLLILIFSLPVYSQFKAKQYIAPAVATFIAGAADGLNQALNYHYNAVDAKLNLNDQFWDPAISWTNKYRNNDPTQGSRFFGSTTFLVFTTDGHHLTRFISNAGNVAAIVLNFGHAKRKWYWYVVEGLGYWIVNRAGFTVVYNSF